MKSVFNCFLTCRDLKHVLKYCIKSGMQTRAGNEYMLKASNLVKKADLTSDLLPRHTIAFHSAFLLPYRGYDFEGTTIGLAFLKSICSDIYSAGIIQVWFIFILFFKGFSMFFTQPAKNIYENYGVYYTFSSLCGVLFYWIVEIHSQRFYF